MDLRRWLHEHSLKLLAIRDTPEAIAGGVAIGIFFGFTPLFGLKTLSAVVLAWLTRSNIVAALLASAMHDVILPFMPVIFRFEYRLGFYLLSHPHHWPEPLRKINWAGHSWRSWATFFTVGKEILVGSVVAGTPVAVLSYLLTRTIVARHQARRHAQEAAAESQKQEPKELAGAGESKTKN